MGGHTSAASVQFSRLTGFCQVAHWPQDRHVDLSLRPIPAKTKRGDALPSLPCNPCYPLTWSRWIRPLCSGSRF